MLDRTRKRTANRWQRYRARRAAGRRMAFLPYDDETLAWLVDLQWLDPRDAGDPHKIGNAAFRMHKASARRR
jgi:hypothetical protein